MFDGKAFGQEIVGIVKGYVDTEVARHVEPLQRRIAELEAREVRDGRDGRDGVDGKDGEPGRDGVGLAGALIDRSGVLILTLSDGTTRDLGVVVGKDGADGRDGADGAAGADGRDGAPGEKGLDGKHGRDGADGKDGQNGRDGFSLESFDADLKDDGRTLVLKFKQGDYEEEYAFGLPVMIDRGVWREGEYEKGDGVTWAGSYWIAQQDTKAKPGDADSGWRMAVKRGRDGKDGKDGERGPEGKAGPPGRDLTQLGPDGAKW